MNTRAGGARGTPARLPGCPCAPPRPDSLPVGEALKALQTPSSSLPSALPDKYLQNQGPESVSTPSPSERCPHSHFPEVTAAPWPPHIWRLRSHTTRFPEPVTLPTDAGTPPSRGDNPSIRDNREQGPAPAKHISARVKWPHSSRDTGTDPSCSPPYNSPAPLLGQYRCSSEALLSKASEGATEPFRSSN